MRRRRKKGRKKKEKFDRGLIRFAHWKREGREKGEVFLSQGCQLCKYRTYVIAVDYTSKAISNPTDLPYANTVREACTVPVVPCQGKILLNF